MTPAQRVPPKGTVMTHWVIYDHPLDYPDGFVLRAHFIMEGGTVLADTIAWQADRIEQLRDMLPPGFVRLDRMAADDPAIAEVWI